jgi:general secretion pathway protein G
MNDNNKNMPLFKFTRAISEGFTLIEIIVVLALLGIVATTVFAAINPFSQIQKSNDAHRKADLESLQHALELYYQDKGGYPPSSANYQIQSGVTTLTWGSAWQPYMATLPKDPTITNNYVYYSPPSASGQTYYLYANLQRGANDPQACKKGNACTSIGSAAGFPTANACGGTCNYGVSSSNVAP